MKTFQGLDFYDLDSLLSEEEKLIRKTVREFVEKEVLSIIEEYNEKAKFPSQLIPKMAELGLLGAQLKGYGCAGLGANAYGLIMQELERGDSGLRSFVSVQGALVMYPILTFGSEEQKENNEEIEYQRFEELFRALDRPNPKRFESCNGLDKRIQTHINNAQKC